MVQASDSHPTESSGIAGLDHILGGGLPSGRITLLRGGPGTGKTVIALSLLHRALTDGYGAVLVTFDEEPEALLEHADALALPLRDGLATGRLKLLDMRPILTEAMSGEAFELTAISQRIEQALASTASRLLAIDAIDVMAGYLGGPAQLRQQLSTVFDHLRQRDTTTLITIGQHNDFEQAFGLEDYIADCVIHLQQQLEQRVMTRLLRVVKRRGGGHGTNLFPYLIDHQGLFLSPVTGSRLLADPRSDHLSTGIPGLDAMIGGNGPFRGSSVMFSGQSGTGKSTLAASFAHAVCRRGEDVLYLSFEESENELIRNQRSVGVDLGRFTSQPQGQGRLTLENLLAVEIGREEHLLRIVRCVQQHQPALVVLDPVSALTDRQGGLSSNKEMLLRLFYLLKRSGVTTVATELLSDDGDGVSGLNVSSIIDVWVKLHRRLEDDRLVRRLTVVKGRGMPTSSAVVEFTLHDHGVEIGAHQKAR